MTCDNFELAPLSGNEVHLLTLLFRRWALSEWEAKRGVVEGKDVGVQARMEPQASQGPADVVAGGAAVPEDEAGEHS